MATCSLNIVLDEPDRIYQPGQQVQGTVVVQASGNVACKGLEVTSLWETHGLGNIDSQVTHDATIFQGDWEAGQEYRYPFEVAVGDWPPTYHGHDVNVDHYVRCRARLSWRTDPRASHPFRVHCPVAPPDGQVPAQSNQGGAIIGAIASVIIVIVVVVFLLNPFFWIVGILGAMLSAGWWFIRVALPKWMLAHVDYKLLNPQAAAGGRLQAELVVRPRKSVRINRIVWTVSGSEHCVSGSGSKRRTHQHQICHIEREIGDVNVLEAGQENRFQFELLLPDDSGCTMDLGNNSIQWSTALRIDIPRWPDWHDTLGFQLIPSASDTQHDPLDTAASLGSEPSGDTSPSEVSFDETIQMLQALGGDESQIARVLAAVESLVMNVEVIPQRRQLQSQDQNKHAYPDGYLVVGQIPRHDLQAALYIPHHMADEFEHNTDRLWHGQACVVGYDHHRKQVSLRIESTP